MLIPSHLQLEPSNSRTRVPAGGIDLIASIDFKSDGATTATLSSSTKVSHGEDTISSAEVATPNHSNQQYSIYAITDAAANIVERYAYTAYGQPTILNAAATVIATSAISNRYTYTAREWDSTVGLYHFRARWMSVLTGRFLTRDPMGFVDGSNVYGYVQGKSLSKVDPAGWATCTPNWTGPCTLDNWRAWYRKEMMELQTWLPKVKPCPCNLSCFDPPYTYCFGLLTQPRVDHKICPTAPPGFMKPAFDGGYHPGMSHELRENNCPDDCQPGNQCTYNANGNLLTDPPGAGSADRYSGGCGVLYSSNHRQGDVLPYDCALQLDPGESLGLLDYHDEIRPPNGGKACAPGPWSR